MPDYQINIIVKGEDKGATSMLEGVAGGLGGIASIAGGNLLADAIGGIIDKVIELGEATFEFLQSSVKESMEFEAGLDNIQAATGATNEEMADLRDLAMDLSLNPQFKVSVDEATAAIDTLARAGVSADDIVAGVGEGVVLLSNATGGGFTQSAEIATDAMVMWGIEAEDMTRVADGVTATVNASKASMNDYALAISQSGGLAAASGVGFEDYNTSIAGTISMFSGGSDAGTSFKTFLNSLTPTTAKQTDMMRDLGLFTGLSNDEFEKAQDKIAKVDEKISKLDPTSKNYSKRLQELNAEKQALNASLQVGSNAFFDENGQMKDMNEIAILLNKTLAGLSEEQRISTMETLFGTDASRTALGLMKLGEVAYTDLALAAEELGVEQSILNQYAEGGITAFEALQAQMSETSAADSAAIRMDNLAGSMEILQGTIDAIKIGIGDEFNPLVRSVVDHINEFLSTNAEGIIGFFGGLADSIATFIPTGLAFLDWVLGLAAQAAAALPVVMDFLTSVGNIAALLFTGDFQGGIFGLAEDDPFIGFLLAARDGLVTLGSIVTGLQSLSVVGLLWQWLTGEEGVEVSVPEILSGIVTSIATFFTDSWPVISEALGDWAAKFWDWVLGPGGVLEKLNTNMNRLIVNIQTWLANPTTQSQLMDIGQGVGKAVMEALAGLWNQGNLWTELMSKLVLMASKAALAAIPMIQDIGVSIGTGLIAGIIEWITGRPVSEETRDSIRGVIEGLQTITTFIPRLVAGIGESIIDGILDGMMKKAKELFNWLTGDFANRLVQDLQNVFRIRSPSGLLADEVGQWLPAGIGQGALDAMPGLTSTMNQIAQGAAEAAAGGAQAATYDQRTFNWNIQTAATQENLYASYQQALAVAA